MRLLIDGYNFLAASGVFASGSPTLAASRRALLDFLAGALSPEDAAATTIVFDAAEAPPGLPRQFTHRGLLVRFADRGQEADEVLEELIRQESAPRRLTVVSSDHRVQRAARRRKARAVDSELFRLELARRPQQAEAEASDSKPVPAGDEDTLAWLAIFRDNRPPPAAS